MLLQQLPAGWSSSYANAQLDDEFYFLESVRPAKLYRKSDCSIMVDGYCKRRVVLYVRDVLITHAPMIDSVYHVISAYTQFSMNDGFKLVDRLSEVTFACSLYSRMSENENEKEAMR
jgi:hypothetical protein